MNFFSVSTITIHFQFKGLLSSLLSEVLIKITELTLSRSLVTVVWMFVVGNNQWSVSVQLFMRAQLCESSVLIVWLCWLVIPTSVVCCCWQVSFTTTALSHTFCSTAAPLRRLPICCYTFTFVFDSFFLSTLTLTYQLINFNFKQ